MKKFDLRRAIGGGYHDRLLKCYGIVWIKRHRCVDAKRQSLLRLREFDLFRKIVDILSFAKRNILISPQRGEKKFLSELCELRNFREGYNLKLSCRNSNSDLQLHSEIVQKNKNKDCGTESAITGFGENSIILFSKMHRSCFGRSALLCRQGKNYNKLFQHKKELERIEPSPAFVMLTEVRKRLLPLTKRESSDYVISNNFSDMNHLQLTTHYSLNRKVAFTLAEVLITLGIIGIVASLTLPSVVNNYKRKQLEVAFKRSSSTLMNALNQTAIEAGYSNYRDLIVCDYVVQDKDSASCVLSNQELFKELNAIFESKLNIVKKISWYDLQNSNKFFYQTYNGAKKLNYNFLYGMARDRSMFVLNDGTVITPISFHMHNPHEISLSFDTNGLNKGPNRLGYDVFIFTTAWNLLCAKEHSQTGYGLDTDYNGRGCYSYAIKNINPDDKTKGYWESLYK